MIIIINAIEAIVNEAEIMRNAYFFTPPGNASSRRRYERQHSHEKIEWEEGGHIYTAEYITDCSCKNVYAHGIYTKDGNKTTITAVKNSLKRLKMNAE